MECLSKLLTKTNSVANVGKKTDTSVERCNYHNSAVNRHNTIISTGGKAANITFVLHLNYICLYALHLEMILKNALPHHVFNGIKKLKQM